MRISRRPQSEDRVRLLYEASRDIARNLADDDRVCGPACTIACPSCGKTTCRCQCDPACRAAPRMLSSEPDSFPIEKGIVPLVFELKRLGAFEPCWSCEGHDGADGGLWRVPRIWFYCDSAAAIALLANTVGNLFLKRKLRQRWQVAAVPTEHGNPDLMYTLEPAFGPGETARLADLQGDVAALAAGLAPLEVPT